MDDAKEPAGPILRLFEVRAKPGCGDALLRKFATTSAEVVRGQPGNAGYFFGRGCEADADDVMFVSIWKDLDAVKARFGAAWQAALLPPGYGALIHAWSLRHIDVRSGWCVDLQGPE